MQITHKSPLHSLQDLGRFGYSHLGISSAGAADMLAHCWANWLVDNPATAATLECPGGGLRARFDQDQWFSLTGADCQAQLNDRPLLPWRSYQARTGDQLVLGSPRAGQIAYLAVHQGFQTPLVLGSRAWARRDQLGEIISESLPCHPSTGQPKAVAHRFIPSYQAPLTLQLIPSYQFEAIQGDLQQGFEVTRLSDRMGIRLKARVPFTSAPIEQSESIALGAVQIPPDGHPIVLNRDRQSLGGYPKLGCLTRLSLSMLAQQRPGRIVGMQPIELAQAQVKLTQLRQFFGDFT